MFWSLGGKRTECIYEVRCRLRGWLGAMLKRAEAKKTFICYSLSEHNVTKWMKKQSEGLEHALSRHTVEELVAESTR